MITATMIAATMPAATMPAAMPTVFHMSHVFVGAFLAFALVLVALNRT